MKLWIFLLTFFYVLGFVPKTILGLYLDTILLVSFGLTIYGLYYKKIYLNQNIKQIRNLLIAFAVYVFVVSLPLSAGNENSDELLRQFIRPIKTLFVFYGAIVLVDLYRKKFGSRFKKMIFVNISLVLIFNALLILLESFSYSIKQILNELFYRGISEIHWQTEMRAGGLMLSGGSMASALLGFGMLSTSFLYFNKRIGFTIFAISTLIYFIAISLTGRTGLVFFLVLPLFINYNNIKSIFGVILIFSLVVLLWITIQELLKNDEIFLNDNVMFNVHRLTASINRYLGLDYDTSFIDDGVENVLVSKFSLPQDPLSLFFGDIGFSNYIFTKVSDMGFNIAIYKYGLVGSTLYYLPIFYMIYCCYKLDKTNRIFFIFMFMFLVIEFKEFVLYSRNLSSIMFLVFFVSQRLDFSKDLINTVKHVK